MLYIVDKNAYLKDNDDVNSDSKSIQHENRMDEATAGPSKDIKICDDINEYELDDCDSDTDITDMINFKFRRETDSEIESEVESNESRVLPKKYFKQNITNPALTYMLEYSGLTEKQILTLLEQNNRETYKDVENMSRISQQIDSFKTIQPCESKNNSLNTKHSSISEDGKEDTKHNYTNTIKSIDVSKPDLAESNTETNINISPTRIANISDKAQVESKNVVTVNSIDSMSDSDDFIEIEDIPIPDMDTITNKYVPQGIEITFRSDEKVVDDMFADVFETHNSELNTDIHPTQSAEIFHYDQEISRNERTFKVDSKEDQIKDKQLLNLKEVDNLNVQTTIDIDPNTLNTNIPLEENQMKDSIENLTNSVNDNVEAANIKDNINVNMLTDHTKRISPIPTNEEELLSLQVRTYIRLDIHIRVMDTRKYFWNI